MSECKCWNPNIQEDETDEGKHFIFCDNCGNDFEGIYHPRKEVIETLNAIQESIGTPTMNDVSLSSLITHMLGLINDTE